jgi:hypothetical protein
MPDQRQNTRRRIIARAEIIAPSGEISLVASIFDISDTGLKIGTPEDYVFPEIFSVRIVGSDTQRAAKIAWQQTGLAGLMFT